MVLRYTPLGSRRPNRPGLILLEPPQRSRETLSAPSPTSQFSNPPSKKRPGGRPPYAFRAIVSISVSLRRRSRSGTRVHCEGISVLADCFALITSKRGQYLVGVVAKSPSATGDAGGARAADLGVELAGIVGATHC